MSSKILLSPREIEMNAVVHHLVSLLITYCKSRDERLSRKTAELIVGIFLLKPCWREVFQKEASKNEIQSFMRECYNFLFDENNISSTTLRMQCLFYGKYLTRDQFREHKKEIVMKNCNYLLQKLKKVWHNTTEDFTDMHDDLVKFILIKEGMDDKDDHSAYDEMKTAVNSVLPVSELSTFVANNQKIKSAFLNEVSSIASGIRLHAWYNKKAGKYLFDVTKLMKDTLPKISDDIHEEIHMKKDMIEEMQTQLHEDIERIGDSGKLMHKKKLLINTTNYYSFIKTLKESIDNIAAETYRLDYKFVICIKELNSALKSGPFCKADKAYPFYKEIGQTWKDLQSEGYLLDFYTNLFLEIKEMHEHVLKLPEVKSENMIKIDELEIETSEEKPILLQADNVRNFLDVTLDIQLPEENGENIIKVDKLEFETSEGKPILLLADNVRNFLDIALDIQGFCAYYCSMGVLIPCVRDVGILMFNNSCYGFSSNKAMKYFQKEPTLCIGLAIKYMHFMPELIISLCKEECFGLPIINTSRYKVVLPVFVSERSVQTVLHCAEENIDPSYHWNQWALRKKAVKHVDLLNKRTHSTQTDLSHFRRENHGQVYLPKDNWTQTRRDNGTTMSRTGVPDLYQSIRKSFL